MMNIYSLFMGVLIVLGTMLTLSSNNWFGAWLGLELNMVAFLAYSLDKMNKFNVESLINYFLIQSASSMVLMVEFISFSFNFYPAYFFIMPLMLKLGMFPFHYWVLGLSMNLKIIPCFLMLTWQKLSALFLMGNYTNASMYVVVMLSGSGCLYFSVSNSLVFKILAFSSIFHLSWLVSSLILNSMLTLFYFMFYSFNLMLIMLFFSQNMVRHFNLIGIFSFKGLMMNLILSLSLLGLPPFFGFSMKWVFLYNLYCQDLIFLMILMSFTSLANIFMYLRLGYFHFVKKLMYSKSVLVKYKVGYFYSCFILSIFIPFYMI
uniref:NADH-ubiquinone oxidoreductase chain 2 n=1 Tax=Acerentomon microrhinus TaxID=996308 RepID=A0A0C4FST0_9HEXA|nr:NADH dehydrogenase subunit 2 [Acerentomon microrhinus]AFI54916.1 NADH dehydrogenase subunit 2 [Acerentomon microrhinus]